MGLFDFLNKKTEPRFSEEQTIRKAIEGKMAYDKRDFKMAAKHFDDYFKMKGFGHFPRLDADDFRMYLNLMISHFYSKDYQACRDTCNTLIRLDQNASDAYAFFALSSYKMGDPTTADKYWEMAKARKNQMAMVFDKVSDVKMEGF